MNAVIFGKNDYGGQLLNDTSPFYGLLYPFDIVEQNFYSITVRKSQFPNIEFVQMLQKFVPKEIESKYDWICLLYTSPSPRD